MSGAAASRLIGTDAPLYRATAFTHLLRTLDIPDQTEKETPRTARVLIVDDNEFNIYALELRLKMFLFNLESATSGI